MLKKFRLVISITLAFFLVVGLSGWSKCSDYEPENGSSYYYYETADAGEFTEGTDLVCLNRTEIKDDGIAYAYTLYDPDTKVMYLYITGSNSGGLTVMLNEYGKPKLYQPQD